VLYAIELCQLSDFVRGIIHIVATNFPRTESSTG
jgi:hypothetical protein